MTKKSLTAKLVILIISFVLVALIAAGFIFGMRWRFPVNFHGCNFSIMTGYGEPKLEKSETADAKEYSAFDISTASYDITVKTSASADKISVDYYTNSDTDTDFSLEKNGSTLVIKKTGAGLFGINMADGRIEVTVPENMKYEYKLSTASGEVTFEADAARLDIGTISGDVKADSVCTKDAEISTTSGEIYCGVDAPKLKLSTTSGETKVSVAVENLDAHSVSGDLEVVLSDISRKCKLDTVSGETKLDLSGMKDYSIDYSTVSGDYDDHNDSRHGDGDTRYTVGEGTLEITCESVSGDLNID